MIPFIFMCFSISEHYKYPPLSSQPAQWPIASLLFPQIHQTPPQFCQLFSLTPPAQPPPDPCLPISAPRKMIPAVCISRERLLAGCCQLGLVNRQPQQIRWRIFLSDSLPVLGTTSLATAASHGNASFLFSLSLRSSNTISP